MRPDRWFHRVLATCLLATALHAQAAGAGKGQASPLAGIAALAKPVTYTETKISLAELVQKVAADTGVALRASREVADEPVAVVVKKLPARELLDQVAELLDYRWRWVGQAGRLPSGPEGQAASLPSYEIYQDVAGKRREEALRQAWREELRQQLRAKVRVAAALGALPAPRFQELLEAEEGHAREIVARRDKLTPEQRSSFTWPPEEFPRAERFSDMRQIASPTCRALAVLVGHLSAPQWAALWREEPLVFSTRRRPGELPLPADVLRMFQALPPPASHEKGEQPWGEATGYPVTVELDASGISHWLILLDVLAAPLRDGIPARPSDLYPSEQGFQLMVVSKVLEHASAENTPGRQAALEKDPVIGVPRRFAPPTRPRRSRFGPQPWSLEDLLPDLAGTFNVQFIADAYNRWDPRFTKDLVSGEPPRSLFQLLDAVGGWRWDRRGNLIRLRSRLWYWERQDEVPLSLLRQWERYGETRGALPLAEYEEMANTLNDNQLWNLIDMLHVSGLEDEIQFQLRDVTVIYLLRDALRLYHSLTPAERQALWDGKSLPRASMRPAQRSLFLTWAVWPDTAYRARYRPEILAGARFCLSVARGVCVRDRVEGLTRYQWEPAEEKPLDGRPRQMTPAAGGEGGNQRFFVTRLEFHFTGAANESGRTASLIVAEPR